MALSGRLFGMSMAHRSGSARLRSSVVLVHTNLKPNVKFKVLPHVIAPIRNHRRDD